MAPLPPTFQGSFSPMVGGEFHAPDLRGLL